MFYLTWNWVITGVIIAWEHEIAYDECMCVFWKYSKGLFCWSSSQWTVTILVSVAFLVPFGLEFVFLMEFWYPGILPALYSTDMDQGHQSDLGPQKENIFNLHPDLLLLCLTMLRIKYIHAAYSSVYVISACLANEACHSRYSMNAKNYYTMYSICTAYFLFSHIYSSSNTGCF